MASSSKDVIKMINHYKKSLEVPDVDEKRVRCEGRSIIPSRRKTHTLCLSF